MNKTVDMMAEPKQRYSYINETYYKRGYCQPSNQTAEERYPKMLDRAKELKPRARRILSFGCSTGAEVRSLAVRFDKAEIIGCDINHDNIVIARRKNASPNIHFHDNLGGLGAFDLVTAFNVFFCMDTPIPMPNWKNTLSTLCDSVSPGGVVMIFRSEHDPKEVLGNDFKVLHEWLAEHPRNKKSYYCGYYKKKSWLNKLFW